MDKIDQQALEQIVKQVIMSMNDKSAQTDTPKRGLSEYTYRDYPLGQKRPDILKTPTGKSINDITLDAVLSGKVSGDDVRIRPETLEAQSQIAKSCGRAVFAGNLQRAAELIAIPDARILEMYNALRPYRSTKSELLGIANELKTKYNAHQTAALVEEAASVYEARGRLKA
jgi:propanediol dehydratase small subunit